MKETDVKFVTRAYDWQGKLIDDHSFIATDKSDIIFTEQDTTEFALDVFDRVQEGLEE